jgi:hypothetical protein
MKNVSNWFKKQMTALAVSLSNVEKNALGQESLELGTDTNKYQRHNQGTLADALDRGEITQEVKELRWRMFKVLEASDKMIISSLGTDEDGYYKLDVKQSDSATIKSSLKKVKVDDYDDYPLEMVVNNSNSYLGTADSLDANFKEFDYDEISETTETDDEGDTKKTLGEISDGEYHSNLKTDNPVKIIRDLRPKFEIEKYAKKLNIRKINEKERLLEFYISKYPDEYDRKTRLLVSEIKKAINNPKTSDMLDIVGVGFTSYKTMGVKDFYQFQYKVNQFDKIIEYDGHYIIKFKSEVILNGEYLLEKYRVKELDERYKNKERKN